MNSPDDNKTYHTLDQAEEMHSRLSDENLDLDPMTVLMGPMEGEQLDQRGPIEPVPVSPVSPITPRGTRRTRKSRERVRLGSDGDASPSLYFVEFASAW